MRYSPDNLSFFAKSNAKQVARIDQNTSAPSGDLVFTVEIFRLLLYIVELLVINIK